MTRRYTLRPLEDDRACLFTLAIGICTPTKRRE
jgi:hypothetical protein